MIPIRNNKPRARHATDCGWTCERAARRSTHLRSKCSPTIVTSERDYCGRALQRRARRREPRLQAVDIPRPAALEDRAALRALADIGLEVPPLDDSLRLARPEHEARIRWHDRRRGHELGARAGLLAGNVVELVALAARHPGPLPHREGEELAFAAHHRHQRIR